MDWIEYVFNNPESEEVQNDGRIRRWAKIDEVINIYELLFWKIRLLFITHFLIENLKVKNENKVFPGYRYVAPNPGRPRCT